ncbi:MAG: glycoside hydrolase family 75 protein [Beijerinckiaceae bacterium]|jgi:hypothetical protein|nr:glycoside hydrolase family 75 protein [Beijerinckiaceae bacterium]
MLHRFALCLATSIVGTAALAQSCKLVEKFDKGKTPVFLTEKDYIYFRANMDVNSDGALESYKIDDLGHFTNNRLTTHSALNVICNGVNIRNASHKVVFNYRRCGSLIRAFKEIRAANWRPANGRYVDFYAIALKERLSRSGKNHGIPCEKDGYYVSQVARPIDSSKNVCDPARWVDALAIPAIVLPLTRKMRETGVQLHDLAAVRVPGKNKWFGAIVGDTNPSKIGEGTVVLTMWLQERDKKPENYRQTISLQVNSVDYLVFPGSRSMLPKLSNQSGDIINEKGRELVKK